jgi:hypothetical protein
MITGRQLKFITLVAVGMVNTASAAAAVEPAVLGQPCIRPGDCRSVRVPTQPLAHRPRTGTCPRPRPSLKEVAMRVLPTILAATALALAPTSLAWANLGHAGHDHAVEAAYGRPGDPAKGGRIVQVFMKETDSGTFAPSRTKLLAISRPMPPAPAVTRPRKPRIPKSIAASFHCRNSLPPSWRTVHGSIRKQIWPGSPGPIRI